MKNPIKLLFTLAFILLSQPLWAAMYKWTDAHGNVHYSQQKPSGRDFQTVRPPAPPPSSASQSREQLDTLLNQQSETDQARSQAQQEADAQQQEAERYRNNCTAAQNNLQTYTNLGHKKLVGDDGVAYYPSAEELAAKRAEAQQQIDTYCQ